jgi:hypothetical protein
MPYTVPVRRLYIDTGIDQDYDSLYFHKKSCIYNHLFYKPLFFLWPGVKTGLTILRERALFIGERTGVSFPF